MKCQILPFLINATLNGNERLKDFELPTNSIIPLLIKKELK
ncbi:MAG: hypothetical protein ACE5SW_12200 [Nitrososphaeraceae archaeon]